RGTGDVIVTTVYEFDAGRGAVDWQRRRLLGARLQGATEFETTGLPDSVGYRADETSGQLTLHDRVIVLRRNNYFVEVIWGSRQPDQPVDTVLAFGRLQAAKV